MRLIEKVEVNYFRSLYAAQIDGAKDLNIIFGRNDSGKSNLLKALNLFFNGRVEGDEGVSRKDFDFSMNISDARKQSSKRFVWIRVTFNTPKNYSGSLGDKVVFKRQWNSTGEIPMEAWIIRDKETVKKASLSPGQRTQLSKFWNDIDFTYIPAIKDRTAFAVLIERMYAAVAQNARLIKKTSDFISAIGEEAESLTKSISSIIPGSVALSPPTDMERLFRNLDFSVGSECHSLLWQKGDGIKARYIPEILRFINESETRKRLFVWGFEEPENSLDLEAASAEAMRFSDFSQRSDTQVFITSHSPAFYLSNAAPEAQGSVRRYFVNKQVQDGAGIVSPEQAVRSIDNLEDTETVMSGAGLLRLPFIIRQISKLNEELSVERSRLEDVMRNSEELRLQLTRLDRPTIYVEGSHDLSLVKSRLDAMIGANQVNVFQLGGTPKTPHALVKSLLEGGGLRPNAKTFFLFDNDKAGRAAAGFISNQKSFNHPVGFLPNAWVWVLPLRAEYREFLGRWGLSEENAFAPVEFMFPPQDAVNAFCETLDLMDPRPEITIHGDIWDAVKSDQKKSYKIQSLAEGEIDWLYSRGIHETCKGRCAEKAKLIQSEHFDATIQKMIDVITL